MTSDAPVPDEDLGSDDSMSDSEEEQWTFSSSQGTTQVIPLRGQANRTSEWTVHSIRQFSPYDLRPRRVTTGTTLLDNITPPRFSLSRTQIISAGFKPFDCRGVPTPIIDNKGRIVACLVPSPTDAIAWRSTVLSATEVFERAAGYADFSKLQEPVLKVGVEYGGPRGVKPQNVKHELANCIETGLILQNHGVQEIAAFHNTILQSFAPKIYAYTENSTDLIYKFDEDLRRELPGVFPAAEFDLGELGSAPRLQDKDVLHGWRALTALGTYDSRYGGDIILWDDGFVLRFPPGATFLFPAALMRYSFVEVQPGLHRYITNGYVSDSTFERTADKRAMESMHRARGRRLEAGTDVDWTRFIESLPKKETSSALSSESNTAKRNGPSLKDFIYGKSGVVFFTTRAMVLVPASPNRRARSQGPSPSNLLSVSQNGRVTRHALSLKLPRLVADGCQSPSQTAPS
ncbi:hypothetical protein B0H13DRAFT_1877968 [Mycena leptocephala]|nr:hypothetical protein B0H13DRAFT_1877968 [Mycena leptocephala]